MSGNGIAKPEQLVPRPIANPAGRPTSRKLFSQQLISDLTAAWERDGPDTLRILAKEDPPKFAMLAYSTLPKDVMVQVEQHAPGGLSVEDWSLLVKVLDVIKAAQVEAGPAEVFGVIEQALRGHYAKQIEA